MPEARAPAFPPGEKPKDARGELTAPSNGAADAPSAARAAARASGASGAPTRPVVTAVRLWTVLLACPLIVLDNLWVVWMERVVEGPYVTTISLFGNAIFVLCGLLLVNVILRRAVPKLAFRRSELLLVYSMVAIGSAFAGTDGLPLLIGMITHPIWYTNTAGLEKYGPYLPPQLMIGDRSMLIGFFNGSDSFYRAKYVAAWLGPTLRWTVVVTVLVYVMQCINVLVRKQWSDRERLTFPITILPLEMTAEGAAGGLWRSRLMWGGFALAGGIDLLNGFAYLYPSLPSLPVNFVDIHPWLTQKPWNAMGFTCYSFYPFAIGLGYLLPVDLLFSCWFFYLFWKAQLIASNLMGWDALPEFPFIKQQAFGGYMAILVFLLWISRRSLVLIARQVVQRVADSEMDDSREGMTYRWAVIGMLGGGAFLTWFFVWLGLPWWLSALSIALYFAISVAITRVRAEFGPPVHDAHFSGPDSMLTTALGTNWMDARQVTAIDWFWWFNRGYRSHPMPIGLETLRMADRTHASQRAFFWATMLAVVVGVLATFWAYVHLGYEYGVAGKFRSGTELSAQGLARIEGWISSPKPPDATANWATVVGFVTAGLLFLMRINFHWWPFHPIGYAISGSWAINLVWLPLFFAWLIKLLVLRYGGLRVYRNLLPFFLGLILGETLVGCGWSLYGMLMGIQTYSFWGG